MSLQHLARQVQAKGRGSDKHLVHVTKGELDSMHGLARIAGHKGLSINPETGLYEAGFLKSILPTLAGAAANYFVPGSGAYVGAATGALTNKDDRLAGAIGGYFGGQGGSDILSALNTAGAGKQPLAAGAQEAYAAGDASAMTPGAPKMAWSNVSKGLQGLATSEGRDALAAAASKDGKAGYGGIMMAGLKALAPTILAGDMSSSGKGASDPRGPAPKPTYRTERTYTGGQRAEGAPQTSEGQWFQYNRIPIDANGRDVPAGAAGGAIGFADGGPVDNRTDSQRAFDYLMGGPSSHRPGGGQTVPLDPKPTTPGAPATPTTPEVAVGAGSSGNPGSGEGGGASTAGDNSNNTANESSGINSIGMGFGVPGANPDVSGKLAGTVGGLVAGLPGILAGQALAAGYNNLNATQNAIAQSIAHMAELQDAAAVDAAAAAGADGTLGAPGSADVGSGMGGVAGPGAGTAAGDAAGNTEGSGGQTSNAGMSAGIAGQGDVGYDSGSNDSGGGAGGIGGGPGGADGAAGGVGSSDAGSTGAGSDTGGAAGSGGDGTGSGGDTGGGDWAEGGIVSLQTGGFVFPADVVSAVGAGSSSAGLETLAKKYGARPVKGKGHGQSDHIPAVIDGKQPARVARDEAILDAEQVTRIGGGDPKKGAKKLYDMMARVRKQSMGRNKQMRPITSAALR
jgi:hypothetical protein